MKAIKLAEPRQVDCVKLEGPIPGPRQVLIRIRTAGICDSNVGAFRGTNKLVSYPRITGHELAGIIEEIPADSPKGLKVGGKVIVNPYLYCGTCYSCNIGCTSRCTSLKILGVHINGGMAEYCCRPADMLVKMPEDMDWTDTIIIKPLTVSPHGIHRSGLKVGEYCAIIDTGPIGLLAGVIAQVYGAHAALLDLVQERLDFARESGIEYVINSREGNPVERISEITDGIMTQQIMEYSNANMAVLQTLDLTSHAGRITLTGWPSKEIPAPTDVIARKEIDIRDARTSTGGFEEAIELVYTKKVDVAKILTEAIGLEGAPETVRGVERNPENYMKVVVKMG